jgi:hypothetical protein
MPEVTDESGRSRSGNHPMRHVRYDTIYGIAWWLGVVTLPWTIHLNSLCIILLAAVWLAEGKWGTKWERLRDASWTLPFAVFFGIHVLGLLYSENLHAGLSEIEKKLTFVALPLMAASGKPLDQSFFDFLKKGFVYSCSVLIIGSLAYTAFHYANSSPIINFDNETEAYFRLLNPSASPLWEHFSYIQVGSWMDLHPAYLSMHVIFCILILLDTMIAQNKINTVSIVLISLFIFFLALLASRMAILSFGIILVYFIVNQLRKRKWFPNVLALSCVLVVFTALIWLNPVSRFRVIQEPKNTGLEIHQRLTQWNSVNLRLLEWRASWNIIKKSWFAGVGTGDAQDALKRYYASFNTSTRNMDFDSHNQYFQTIIELGFMGIFSLLVCFFLPAFRPGHSILYLSFILLFSLMCLTESMLARQKGIVFFTLFQSLFIAVRPTPR